MTQATPSALGARIKFAPAPYDKAAAQWCAALSDEAQQLNADEAKLLEGVAGCSPYLRRLMMRDTAFVLEAIKADPADILARACKCAKSISDIEQEAEQLKILRRAKDEAALVIALADISEAWGVMEAAAGVAQFADAAVEGALQAAVRTAKLSGGVKGIAAIAMGKHGAHELNYSSDIDLVMLFDVEAMDEATPPEAQAGAVKAAKVMVHLLQTQTADGYVFRTDLRLRPDPGASALAVSVRMAEAYYEAYGQNWERMAYIKARAAAGDIDLGNDFLKALRPFVWRKYLDFAAIEDVQAVKRQIHSAKGGAEIEFEAHDIKVGRGGIREIEFYAQTQQLILGGKDPDLRQAKTLNALAMLSAKGRFDQTVCCELSEAYDYLRKVEHRVQMVNDEQTHRIPKEDEAIKRLALFLGEGSPDAFRTRLLKTLKTVANHYDNLFRSEAEAHGEGEPIGRLVFTGVEGDPETIETLKGLGFKRAEEVSAQIRRWHTGAIRATRTERARTLLTKIMSPFLEALSKAGDPDEAFFAFADFLKHLPAGVQVFAMLDNNVDLVDELIRIMTISPYLGRALAQRINVVEGLIENGLAAPPPAPASYKSGLQDALHIAESYEEQLNVTRRWASEQKLPVAARLATGLIDSKEASRHFTAIADAVIHGLAPAAQKEMHAQHGVIKGGALSIVGLGRLGAGQLSATSDLDLMFIYDAPEGAASDGARSLSATEYFTRLVRRIITALSAATEEGGLYEVDMQLRPSGSAGPAAVNMGAFRRYYEQDAWVWEFMALTKGRLVLGEGAAGEVVNSEVETILRRQRDPAATAAAVVDMRQRLLDAKTAKSVWDVKTILGGLTDIDFICQYLSLMAGEVHGRAPQGTVNALQWLAMNKVLTREDEIVLIEAEKVFDAVLHVSRVTTGGVFEPAGAGPLLAKRMASLCGAETIDAAEKTLARHQEKVADVFRRVVRKTAEISVEH